MLKKIQLSQIEEKSKKPTDDKKDAAIRVRARKNVSKQIDEIFDKKYFTKYPRGKKPYGFQTGIPYDEWKKDTDKIQGSCDVLIDKEITRLNSLVCSNWIRKATNSSLDKPLPLPIYCMIKNFAATTRLFGGQAEVFKYYFN